MPADAERDRSELSLVRQLLEEGETPLLCICRGLQVLNVGRWRGHCTSNIPDIRDEDIHRNEAGLWAMQEVRVMRDSLIAEVMGVTELRTSSGHHQAVKDVAAGLRVTARADRRHH